jgi:hypothetical protein
VAADALRALQTHALGQEVAVVAGASPQRLLAAAAAQGVRKPTRMGFVAAVGRVSHPWPRRFSQAPPEAPSRRRAQPKR